MADERVEVGGDLQSFEELGTGLEMQERIDENDEQGQL